MSDSPDRWDEPRGPRNRYGTRRRSTRRPIVVREEALKHRARVNMAAGQEWFGAVMAEPWEERRELVDRLVAGDGRAPAATWRERYWLVFELLPLQTTTGNVALAILALLLVALASGHVHISLP